MVSDDLLTSQYREKISALSHPTQGHCYASSEAVFHLIGGKASGYNSYCSSYKNEDGERETHWFLKKHHHIIDPTADQFTCLGKTPPYDIGKPIGFLTKAPSKRARIIMERLIAFKAELVPKVKF